MSLPQNEAFSRILIDKALEFSGWALLDPRQVRFELSGLGGRADYVLSGERGPLAVLEAKKTNVDPYDAKEQARGYAENLKAPFVILSNGTEHWFWNYTRDDQDAYRIERLPSRTDLERLRLKNLQPPRPLLSDPVGPDYLRPFRSDLTVRRYQIKALDTVSSLFDAEHRRKFLLEMATGTGKTLLCAALTRLDLARSSRTVSQMPPTRTWTLAYARNLRDFRRSQPHATSESAREQCLRVERAVAALERKKSASSTGSGVTTSWSKTAS